MNFPGQQDVGGFQIPNTSEEYEASRGAPYEASRNERPNDSPYGGAPPPPYSEPQGGPGGFNTGNYYGRPSHSQQGFPGGGYPSQGPPGGGHPSQGGYPSHSQGPPGGYPSQEGYGGPSPTSHQGGYGGPPPQQSPQEYGRPPQQSPQGYGRLSQPHQGYGDGPQSSQGYGGPPPPQQPHQGYGDRPQSHQSGYGDRPQSHQSGGYGGPPSSHGPNRPPPSAGPQGSSSPGPAASHYSGGGPQQRPQQRPHNSNQQRPSSGRPPPGGGPGGLPGGLDLGALGPLAAKFFGGGSGGGPKGGSGSGGGLGALSAFAPMAMQFLGSSQGGKSHGGSSGGGLGPLMGMASGFLGGNQQGGGGGPGSGGKSSQSGFFSKILKNVFGNRNRDLDSGSMSGLGRQEAERLHQQIYYQSHPLAYFNDEQLGAAAAVQAITEMQRTGKLSQYENGREEASQELLGAVMDEAVNLYERQKREGGNADKENTATAAVQTALKIIDDAADSLNHQQQYQY